MEYPRNYNAATDMVDRNVAEGRGTKVAFIDPDEQLTYGELQMRCNRMANLLGTYDIPREARVAVLLLDTVDFPVAYWGAIKAGVVPVCLNTLLPAEQYAYILGDSRAKALFVSAQLLPVVQPILGKLPFLKHVFVSGGDAPAFALPFRDELNQQSTEFRTAETSPDETAFWLYSSGSTGMPWHARGRRRLFGRQAVLCLRPRQRHVIPDVGRRNRDPAARAADTGQRVRDIEAVPADFLFRCADVVCRDARLAAGHAREQFAALARLRVSG
jgi:non-ribosomal peptide synthetase component F